MTNMSLFNKFVGSNDNVIMDLEHDKSGGDVMIEVVFVAFLCFFQGSLEVKRDELVQLICLIKFRGSNNLDLEKRFDY